MDGGYWSLGDRGYSPFQGGTNVFSISDSFDMIRGNHDIKIGGCDSRQSDECARLKASRMVIGSSLAYGRATPAADFLLGLPSLAIHDQAFDGDVTGRRWKLFRPFVEDNWKSHQEPDGEPGPGLGAGDAHHRSAQPSG